MNKNRVERTISAVFLTILCAAILIPIVCMVMGALLKPIGFWQLLLRQPDYLLKFWKSFILSAVIALINCVVSCMSGFAFAKYRFRGRSMLYFIMILLMMMPLQVTLVPNYIVLDRLHLLNTWAALALPAIFVPLGTVLMTQVFRSVPNEVIDSARIDGATTAIVLWRILVPVTKGGTISLLLLTFIDSWNMVEQPMAFLEDTAMYPFSVFLSTMNETNIALSFAGGVLSILPVLLLFLYFQKELLSGLEFMGIK